MYDKKEILTKLGKKEFEIELEHLLKVKRPKVLKDLAEARAQGDLSENADYDAIKEKQAHVEDRITEIDWILNNSKVIRKKNTKLVEKVRIGSKVKLMNLDTKKIATYTIVGTQEVNPLDGKISNESPLAMAILGNKINSQILVTRIDQKYEVKIIDIIND